MSQLKHMRQELDVSLSSFEASIDELKLLDPADPHFEEKFKVVKGEVDMARKRAKLDTDVYCEALKKLSYVAQPVYTVILARPGSFDVKPNYSGSYASDVMRDTFSTDVEAESIADAVKQAKAECAKADGREDEGYEEDLTVIAVMKGSVEFV